MAYYPNLIPLSTITAPTLAHQFTPDKSNYPLNYPPHSTYEKYPYPVWVYGTACLNQQAAAVPITNEQPTWGISTLQSLVQVLATTLGNYQGTGISANQVGILWQMFLVDSTQFTGTMYTNNGVDGTTSLQMASDTGQPVIVYPFNYPSDCRNGSYYVFINPTLHATSSDMWPAQEECLSIPDLPDALETPRHQQFTLTFRTIIGGSLSGELTYTSQYDDTTPPTSASTLNNAPNWVLQHEANHLQGTLYTEISTGITPADVTYLTTTLPTGGENGVIQQPPVLPPLPLKPDIHNLGPIVHH